MGLDMYLREDHYIPLYEHTKKDESELYASGLKVLEVIGAKNPVVASGGSVVVTVTVAYWRKVNNVHQWFVDNTAGGVDECQTSEVSTDQLIELRDLCQEAMDVKNSKLMPPSEGFFFGSTDIDEWYWSDLQDTVDQLDPIIKNALAEKDKSGYAPYFQYQASW